MFKVFRSISQKTTFPPKCSTTLAVEIQVEAGTMASSPDPKPKAARERCSAVVQKVTAKECLASVKVDHFSSNSLTCGPCSSHPERIGYRTLSISAFVKDVRAIGIIASNLELGFEVV